MITSAGWMHKIQELDLLLEKRNTFLLAGSDLLKNCTRAWVPLPDVRPLENEGSRMAELLHTNTILAYQQPRRQGGERPNNLRLLLNAVCIYAYDTISVPLGTQHIQQYRSAKPSNQLHSDVFLVVSAGKKTDDGTHHWRTVSSPLTNLGSSWNGGAAAVRSAEHVRYNKV